MLILAFGIAFLSIYVGQRIGVVYGILFLLVELMLVEAIRKKRY